MKQALFVQNETNDLLFVFGKGKEALISLVPHQRSSIISNKDEYYHLHSKSGSMMFYLEGGVLKIACFGNITYEKKWTNLYEECLVVRALQ